MTNFFFYFFNSYRVLWLGAGVAAGTGQPQAPPRVPVLSTDSWDSDEVRGS